jgi:hypothetical protein
MRCGIMLASTSDCCGCVLLFRAVAKLQQTDQLQIQRKMQYMGGVGVANNGWCANMPYSKGRNTRTG